MKARNILGGIVYIIVIALIVLMAAKMVGATPSPTPLVSPLATLTFTPLPSPLATPTVSPSPTSPLSCQPSAVIVSSATAESDGNDSIIILVAIAAVGFLAGYFINRHRD